MRNIETQTEQSKLHIADLSFAVAVIPTPPLRNRIAKASLAISEQFENRNVIDNEQFPAHLSLYLGGTDRKFISSFRTKLEKATKPFLSVNFTVDKIYQEPSGFIGVNCYKSKQLLSLLQIILEKCGELHRKHPRYRPHLIERWPSLTKQRQQLLLQFGTYKLPEQHSHHLSVALVSERNLNEAFQIAKRRLDVPKDFNIKEIQIVDIGHKNEQWHVLYQWSGTR